MKETHQRDAECIDDVLTYLGCTATGMSSTDLAHYAGFPSSANDIVLAMRQSATTADDLERRGLPKAAVHIVTGSENAQALCCFGTVRKLGVIEKYRLNRLGVLPGVPGATYCRALVGDVFNTGKVEYKRLFFTNHGGLWKACNSTSYSREKSKRTFSAMGNRYKEWRECDAGTNQYWPALACVAAWARVTRWSIEFRLRGAPGLWMTSDAHGAQELLRMRDAQEGKSRRDALKNWVREHWRQNRADPELENRVRQHLRGADTCSWFGLECRIAPSSDDLALNDRLRREKISEVRIRSAITS